MNKKPFQSSRREALQKITSASALFFNASVFKSLVISLVTRDIQAQAALGSSANLITILSYGAPPKWGFDAFLNPTGDPAQFISNATVKNFLGTSVGSPMTNYSGNNAEASYQQTGPISFTKNGQAKQIYLPKIWDGKIPIFNGSTVTYSGAPDMKALLPNICMIRGMDMLADLGHGDGPMLNLRPNQTRPSISGLVADGSDKPLSALGLAGDYSTNLGYASVRASMNRVRDGADNPIQDLVSPFLPESDAGIAIHNSNMNQLKSWFDEAISAMGMTAANRQPGSEKLYLSYQGSKSLFDQAATLFTNLSSEFNSRKNKYEAIASLCRDQATAPGSIPSCDMNTTSYYSNFARGLAVAEYFIQKGLTASVTIAGGGIGNIGVVNKNGGGTEDLGGYFWDEHSGGFGGKTANRQISLSTVNFYYRMLMASLYEFKRAIGQAEFDKTVIMAAGEYGRIPQDDGTGSEHDPRAQSIMLYSGLFQSFVPVGNIKKTGGGNNFRGTYGESAPTMHDSGLSIVLNRNDLAATLSTLVGVTSPVAGNELLKRGSDGKICAAVEDPKNV